MIGHHKKKSGQALTEVLTYTGLLAIAAIVVISLYGKQIQSGMAAITGGMAGEDAEVVSYAEEAASAASMDADTGNYSPYSDGGSGYMAEDSGYLYAHEESSRGKFEKQTSDSLFTSQSNSETFIIDQLLGMDQLESHASTTSNGMSEREKEIQQIRDEAARENARIYADLEQVKHDLLNNFVDAIFNSGKAITLLATGDVAGTTANIGRLTGNLFYAMGKDDLADDIRIASDAFDLFSGLHVDPPHKVLSKVSSVTSGLSDKLNGSDHVVSRNLHEANRWIKMGSVVGDRINLMNERAGIENWKTVLTPETLNDLLESSAIKSVGNVVDGIRVPVQW